MAELTQDELIANWVKALRSGEFKQIQRTMYRDGRYCCLGVAGHLIGQPDTWLNYAEVKSAYGLRDSLGEYFAKTENCSLASHNDSGRWNFNQIADLIESRPPGLFIEKQETK